MRVSVKFVILFTMCTLKNLYRRNMNDIDSTEFGCKLPRIVVMEVLETSFIKKEKAKMITTFRDQRTVFAYMLVGIVLTHYDI